MQCNYRLYLAMGLSCLVWYDDLFSCFCFLAFIYFVSCKSFNTQYLFLEFLFTAVNMLLGSAPKLLIEYMHLYRTTLSTKTLVLTCCSIILKITQCNLFVCEYLEEDLYCIVVFNVSVQKYWVK